MAHGSCDIVRIPHVKGTSSDIISHVPTGHTHSPTHLPTHFGVGIIRILLKQVSVPPLVLLSVVWAEVGLVWALVSLGWVSVSGILVMPIPSSTHPPTHAVQWLLRFLSFLWCFVALFWLLFPFTDLLFSLFCCLNFCLVFKMIFDLALVVVLVCLRMLSLFVVFFVAVPLFFLPPFSLPILFPILFLHSLYLSSLSQSSNRTEPDNDLKHMLCIVLYSRGTALASKQTTANMILKFYSKNIIGNWQK